MRFVWIGALAILFVIGVGVIGAASAEKPHFAPGRASSYSSKQTNSQITVAAVAYDTEELAHSAFGKLNPYQHGVLPVLVIIQNETGKSMNLEGVQAQYEALDGDKIDPTPPDDVRFVGQKTSVPGGNDPRSPIPLPKRGPKKSALDELAIVERAFVARMLPPHESANGFFYFQTKHRPGAKLYLTGINEAMTGQGILFFEIPLDANLNK